MKFLNNSSNIIEGYLGDKESAELLFVLKEPNTQNANNFWLKRALDGKENNAERYIYILGVLAGKILGKPFGLDEERRSLLKRCAYINLYPFRGKETASSEYMQVLNEFGSIGYDVTSVSIARNSPPKQVAQNRMAILHELSLLGCRYAVTTQDIFSAVSRESKTDIGIVIDYNRRGQKCQKSFKRCKLFDDRLTLYSFWHPAYTKISYENLNKITL